MQKTANFHILNSLYQSLIEVYDKLKHADRVIDKYFRANPKWSAEEKKLYAESLYEIIRHRRLLEFISENEDHWKSIGVYFLKIGYKLPQRREFDGLTIENIKLRQSLQKTTAIEFSIPDWVDQLGQSEFSERWPKILAALNEAPSVFIRANRLKTDVDKLLLELKKDQIKCEKYNSKNLTAHDCIKVLDRSRLFSSKAYREGLFEMQDVGSQTIAPLLQLSENLNVVDACAGSGGKTLHIAGLMKNQGHILSMDVQPQKLKDLSERVFKAGVEIVRTKTIESNKTIEKLKNQFERVLLDVPCSGFGVLKRNPDSKWKSSPQELEGLIKLQRDILCQYTQMCKQDGLVVYATCSIFKAENEEQIKWFLNSKQGVGWQLLSEHRIWPDVHGCDGFYAAVLKKIATKK